MNTKIDSVNLTFVFTVILLSLLWKKSTGFCMFNFARDTNVALVIWPSPEHLKFELNKNVYLECRLKGSANLGSEFKWISPTGTEVPLYRPNTDSVFSEPLQQGGGLSLYILNANNDHIGQWTCSAMYGDVIRLTTTFTLEFGYELTFVDAPSIQVLNSLEDSKISCSSQGHPEVEWRKNGQIITTGGRYEVVQDGLKIHEVNKDDEDNYECRIYAREQGKVNITTVEVRVETPTNIAQSSENILDQTSENNSSLDDTDSSELISKTFCDFESLSLCGFNQDQNDDFNWTRIYGETPTLNTGPAADHTYGTKLGHYMYIESSWPRLEKDKARLISPPLNGNSFYCVSFYYHMYGQDMGYLNVFKNNSTGPEILLWSTFGNQGKQWNRIHVTVQAEQEEMIWIVFEGVTGASFTSDIAIDDILMTNKPCNS